MLILKLSLVPLLIAGVTLIGRRWGTRVAGMFAAMPIIAGPIALFITIEQGTAFGAKVAVGAIAAIAVLLVFFLGYAWTSRRMRWPASVACALSAWALAAVLAVRLPQRLDLAIVLALVALLATPRLLPPIGALRLMRSTPSRLDLPVRMLAGVTLTLLVTAVANRVGAAWSGVLTVFPIITIVLAVFTHREGGPAQVSQFFRGMVLGLYAFLAFFVVLSLLLPHGSIALAFLVGIAAALLVQGIVGWLLARH